nr:hva22-like protein a [Quercus suber]
MGFVGYLFLIALKCFDLFAWPLFSLGYPLCASICAIESNSNSDIRKLIAFWVFYSLISLFEHAFMKLLEWLPFWPHMKLMIMYWLMIPHFSGVVIRLSKSIENNVGQKEDKDVEVTEENEVAAIERVTPIESTLVQTGKSTETLTDMNGNKHLAQIQELADFVEVIEENEDVEVTKKNEDVEVTEENKDVEVTEENEEVEVTEENEEVEVTEENENVEVTEENEDVEVIEKNEVVTEENEDVEVTEKNEVAAIEMVTPIESTLVQIGKSTETLTDMNVTSKSTLEFTEVRLSKKRDFTKVQKEWACAICKVTIESETTLNSHLQGKRHNANCEVLKAITRAKKKIFPTSTTKKHEHVQTQKKCASSNGLKEEVNIKQWDVHGLQISSKKIVQDTRLPLLCYICNVRCTNKDNLDAHLKGKKHLARIQELADFVEGQHA